MPFFAATPPADQSWEKIPCDVMHQQVRKRHSPPTFNAVHLKRSFYQDRLGTNIGKTHKKEAPFSPTQLPANCEQDVEPGLAGDPYVPLCPNPAGAPVYIYIVTKSVATGIQ
jgi:hypothetical protein